ncbi:MAG: UvrD-helicase domain-containing protein, partial [Gemmatimonadetes bacterium]|nr:UvrD-helicase domain-containing protein [Gemmatimonadota bacterium]
MSGWQRFLSIAASAGSGKTFRLAHRYIALLAAGVAPERIIAVTFSRKAAGEIFDDIVSYLCAAARDPERAAQTGSQIGRPEATCREFQDLLRHLVDAMKKLRIQTLDSFTVGIVRSFPNELGLSGELEILDEQAGARRRVREDVFGELFSTRRENTAGRQAFISAFRRATAGDEGKGMDQRLDDFIAAFHRDYYLVAPRAEQWGCERGIWPAGALWQEGDGDDASEVADALAASITGEQFTRK